MADKVFFSTWPEGTVERYGLSGTEMGRSGDQVYFEYVDFDKEDQRPYTYRCSYSVDRHRQALEELRRTGQSVVIDDIPNNDLKFWMTLNGEIVTLHLSGCGGCTGGGTPVHSMVGHSCKFSDLIIEE